jgi:hypothetical protein
MTPKKQIPNSWHSDGVMVPPEETKNNTHRIEIIKDGVQAELTAKQFTDLHDRMTDYYNTHYQELTETE